jgi:hypothetical protein
MLKNYFGNLKFLWFQPSEFFDSAFNPEDEKSSTRFAVLTGFLVALELGVAEILSGGSALNVALVMAVMLLGMPFATTAWIYLWAGFMKLCAYLLGEDLPWEPVRNVVAYSLAGIALVGVGFGLGKWLALAMFVFQVFGVQKILHCSRWTAAVFVGLPFSLVVVLGIFVAFMFKVFK